MAGNVTGDVFASNGTSKILDNGTDGTDAAFTGSLTGNVTGNVTGNIIGNVTGNLTGNADTTTRWLNSRTVTFATVGGSVSDATGSFNLDGTTSPTTQITLRDVNSNIGAFGSGTAIPIVTVNAKGLVTAVTTANIATNLGIAGDVGTDSVSLLTDTLTFEGGAGLIATVTNNKVTIGLTGSVSLSDLTITSIAAGSITVSGALSSGNTSTANLTVNGNAVVTGDLTVQGTTTTVNSTTVSIGDKNLELAKDATTAISADGGGITIKGPTIPATLTYAAIGDTWNLNKDLVVANVIGALTGNASTATAWQTSRNISFATGDVSGNFSTNGTANVSNVVLTLANTGVTNASYGDAITVPNFTVDAKGRLTAAGQTLIPTATTTINGLASFNSTNFDIASGAVSIKTIDGGTYGD